MTDAAGVQFRDARGPDGMRIYAIGDVHGRFDCLSLMHELIAEELRNDPPRDRRIIHLGDYVDRGPRSAEVLDFLASTTSRDPRTIALRGNHDQGFLDFLADPQNARLFIDYGGFDTAASYGVLLDARSVEGLRRSHREMMAAMPEEHLRFLRDLRRWCSFGDFFFCHAGIRPGVALEAQDPDDLIWIRDAFLASSALFSKVIVHGHTPKRAPEIRPNRINVDTMAFDSGTLTALVIEGAEKRFLTARC